MANLFAVPNYIKAASPEGLRRNMFKVQQRDSMQYKFFNIQFTNGFWFAWYFYEPKTPTAKLEAAKELVKE